jgi:hypothetical protein
MPEESRSARLFQSTLRMTIRIATRLAALRDPGLTFYAIRVIIYA